jgi:hypothetical protein
MHLNNYFKSQITEMKKGILKKLNNNFNFEPNVFLKTNTHLNIKSNSYFIKTKLATWGVYINPDFYFNRA